MKDDDTTVVLHTPMGSSGPMKMSDFRKRVKEVSSAKQAETGRRLITEGNPEDYFIEFPLEDDFDDNDCEYFVAMPENQWGKIAEIGAALCSTKLQHLRLAKIAYLWKCHGGSRNGKAILGKAVKANALVRTFTDRNGFVVLSADHVRTFKLIRYQMEALIFHELLHFTYDEGVLGTHGHDFEAFGTEVKEYGLWKPDLRLAGEAFSQMKLPGVEKK